MSTKTTIKRVALVAAVALTLGGFSAVSASAANNVALTFTSGDGAAAAPYNTGAGVAGPANSVKVTLTATASKDSYVAVVGGTVASADTTTAVISSDGKSVTRGSAYTGNAVLTVPTPTVGTITLNLYTGTAGVYGTTIVESVVITVNATAQSGLYSAAKSSVLMAAGETTTAVTTDATVNALASSPSNTDSAVATIAVVYRDALGANITTDSITATISGPGVIAGIADSWTVTTANDQFADAANNYSKSVTSTNGGATFTVFNNGQSGVSTITIKNSAGTILGTKTITFTSTTVASIAVVQKLKNIQGDTAAETKYVVAITLKDASGNLMVGKAYAPTVTYSTGSKTVTAVADTGTSDANGQVWYGFTPGAAATYGAVTATFTDPTTATITGSVTFNLSSAVAASLSISAADVNAGDAITYVVDAKDANGYAVPDGIAASSYIASGTGSAGISSFVYTGTSVDGSMKVTSSGAIVPTSTAKAVFTLTGSTAGVASTYLAKALSATDVTVNFAVASAGSESGLAVDAANAATDAANAAAEEASNATEAASEALAAVNSLATTVASLIAGIKAQLTALTVLVKKLQAKK